MDFLSRAELEDADREGVMSMRPAFSLAPQGEVRFVQHRIEAEGAEEEVWRLIEAGARIHVCGDGSRMAPGVREAFRQLYVRHREGRFRCPAVAPGAGGGGPLRGGRPRGRLTERPSAGCGAVAARYTSWPPPPAPPGGPARTPAPKLRQDPVVSHRR
ncbi:hypothetical protein [Streptomyces sp. NPDC056387]|uniref:hypothetical protein n=1 Tax=Streptomyces sp. NPDC056387 TaxID=3345803 RepID=UPI0035D6CDF3